MPQIEIDETNPEMWPAKGKELEHFFALPLKERLSLILDRSFASWCAHANQGVSLVYDQSTLMIAKIVKQILAVEETDSFAGWEVFSTRMVLNIETGYDAYDPDAGAFERISRHNEGRLFMIETAVRAMSSDEALFDPRYLVPQDPYHREALKSQFRHIFSAQFRFWPDNQPDSRSRVAALHNQMTDFPQVTLVEKQLSASLRKTNRFRLKRKVLDFSESPVWAIAIGLDW